MDYNVPTSASKKGEYYTNDNSESPVPHFTYAIKNKARVLPQTVSETARPQLLNPTTTQELKHTQLNSYKQYLLNSRKQVSITENVFLRR